MKKEAMAEALTRSGLLDGVTEPDRLDAQWKRLTESESLCKRDDIADCLWVVLSGVIAVTEEGKTVARRERGYVVGEQALVESSGRRTAELVALGGPIEVLEIRRTALDAHPQSARLYRNLATVLSLKLTEATRQRGQLQREIDDKHDLLRRYLGARVLSEKELFPESFFGGPKRYRAVVWFSDISGFSRQVLDMSPERAAQLVKNFLTPQVEAIEARGGCIDKFVGDLVMAFWIVTSETGESECSAALDAARAALAGIGAVEIGAKGVRSRTGLHIGEVAAGNFGTATRMQYTLIGPHVNLAARLEQVRAEGETRLGWIRTSDAFFAALPADRREHLPVQATVTPKNMEPITIHTSAVEE